MQPALSKKALKKLSIQETTLILPRLPNIGVAEIGRRAGLKIQ
jgi:hypothetical protein